jgi:hypothetical protein
MEFIKISKYYLLAALIILAVISLFIYKKRGSFSPPIINGKILEESGKMEKSGNTEWWLNSGGIAYLNSENNPIATNQGNLIQGSKWQKLYANNNSRDTEGGFHPQNIFRLVTRNKWQDLEQQLYFKINKINLSKSEYRNESNGILLFNRYQDGDNLYYTGLRVDGDAVIKKKIDGKYYTIKEKHVFTGGKKYDTNNNPNLLPASTWVGIKSEVVNISEDAVEIKLYVDKEGKGDWQLVLEATDKADQYGSAPFADAGYGGIRTDFMDVEFRGYQISNF